MPDTQTVHEIEPAANQNCIMQRTLGPARGIDSVRVCLTDGNWRQRELFYEMEDRLEGGVASILLTSASTSSPDLGVIFCRRFPASAR